MPRTKAPDPTDAHVGLRVRAARLAKGMSQSTLAAGLQLTFQQVQKYEKGANRIGSSRLQQIARIVGKPVEWFFAGGPGALGSIAPGRDLATELLSEPYGAELAEHFLRIPHGADRRVVVDVARALAERATPHQRAAE